MIDDKTVVLPAKGDLKATAQLLLSLADDPRDVQTDGNGTEFRVPQELAERYAAVAYEPPKPRRGRPPKQKKEVTDSGDDLF